MKNTPKMNFKSRGIILMVSAVLMLALFVTASPQPANAAQCAVKHTVEAGDTVHYLADLYQVDWRDIVEANDLESPYVLVIGQVICIPPGAQTTTTTTTTTETTDKKKAALIVDGGLYSIMVDVQNFPKNTPYYVNVANPPDNPIIYRVGRLQTNKNGNFTGYFKLPADFYNTRGITVCLKNAWTDTNSCVIYKNPYYYYILSKEACGPPRRMTRR